MKGTYPKLPPSLQWSGRRGKTIKTLGGRVVTQMYWVNGLRRTLNGPPENCVFFDSWSATPSALAERHGPFTSLRAARKKMVEVAIEQLLADATERVLKDAPPVHCPKCAAEGRPAIPAYPCEHMTLTGRFSSLNPNIQNLPRHP